MQALCRDNIFSIEDEDLHDLCNAIRVMVASWVSYRSALNMTGKLSAADTYHGLLKALFVVKPYFTDEARIHYRTLKEHYTALTLS